MQPIGAYTDLSCLLMARFASKELAIPAKARSQSAMSGNNHTKFRGRGMEFAEVRQYQAGDDIRSIDWRVTARAQTTYTKLYTEEREKPVFFLVDQRASMFFGSKTCFKSVFAAQLASFLGWTASDAGDRIGAMIAHSQGVEDIRPKGSQHAMLTLLNRLHNRNLALSSPIAGSTEVDLAALLADCRRALKPGSTLVIISDFSDWSAACQKLLTLLVRHNDILLFHIFDRLEQQLPEHATLAVSDGHRPVSLNHDNCAKVATLFESRTSAIQETAHTLGIVYHRLECSTFLVPWLQKHFGKKSRRPRR